MLLSASLFCLLLLRTRSAAFFYAIAKVLVLPWAALGERMKQLDTEPQERRFNQMVNPPFTGDLNLPALSEEDQALVRECYTALNDDKMHSCLRCQEHWFDMKRNGLGICSRCISRDGRKPLTSPTSLAPRIILTLGKTPAIYLIQQWLKRCLLPGFTYT